jgi:hypothetical protein
MEDFNSFCERTSKGTGGSLVGSLNFAYFWEPRLCIKNWVFEFYENQPVSEYILQADNQ